MKNLFKVFLALFLTVGFLNAQSLNQKNQVDGYDVEITSTRDLSAGSNELFANITKDGKAVTTAKVKIEDLHIIQIEQRWVEPIENAAKEFGVDPLLIYGIANAESGMGKYYGYDAIGGKFTGILEVVYDYLNNLFSLHLMEDSRPEIFQIKITIL